MRSWKVLANHCHLEIMKEALTNLNDGEMARLWTGTCFLHQWYFWFSEIHFANCSSFSQFISQFLPFLKIQICNLWNFCSFSFAKGAIMSASWQWDWPDDCRRRRAETSWRAQRTLQLLCKQVTWPSTWRSQRWLITVLIREKKTRHIQCLPSHPGKVASVFAFNMGPLYTCPPFPNTKKQWDLVGV